MQITDLYQTKITCSTYNANIDSTDTIITVSLIDFNGNAVTGKSVTLTCDKGYFNKNGSTTISGTTTKSITATTNSSGEINATWTASEWGLCTFSASSSNCQVDIHGWRILNTGSFVFRVNGHQAQLRFIVSDEQTSVKTTFEAFGGYTIPVGYRPEGQVVGLAYSNSDVIIAVKSDGQILRRSMNKTSTIYCGVYGQLEWEY